MEEFNITIIGAGVVGLAIAAEVGSGNNLLIEQYESFGKETSSRNSEVIHAGIYYPTDTLKAKLCVKGNRMLYELCKEHNIAYKKLGKIIVATDKEEEKDLEIIYNQGVANGVPGLKMLSKSEVKKEEPHIYAISGIYSPETGIVDSHNLMRHYELKAKEQGFTFAYGCLLTAVEKTNSGYKLTVKDSDGELYNFNTKILINSAGLNSDKVSQMLGITDYKLHYCKGEYFHVGSGKNKYLKHLVYPHPTKNSLGIHTVLDLQGQIKLGPNAFYVDSINYDVDKTHKHEFYNSIKTYLPFVDEGDLTPDTSGIRPKLQGPNDPVKDFVICHEEERGLPGFINLVGIESPGLTAAPAIAEYVASILK